MSDPEDPDITDFLMAWSAGDTVAFDRLVPVVFDRLRSMAAYYFEREDSRHTLQPTALVSELYLRLAGRKKVRFKNRAHFFGTAATLMRRILVDYARTRDRLKRGSGARPVSLEAVPEMGWESNLDLLSLDDALQKLAEVDSRQARIVELRFFTGLQNDEIAELLSISITTVKREWETARLWLFKVLGKK
ncbi:MAG: ECF-type sigma factor [Acidobacteriota bacterium]